MPLLSLSVAYLIAVLPVVDAVGIVLVGLAGVLKVRGRRLDHHFVQQVQVVGFVEENRKGRVQIEVEVILLQVVLKNRLEVLGAAVLFLGDDLRGLVEFVFL